MANLQVSEEAFLPCFVSRLGTCQVGLSPQLSANPKILPAAAAAAAWSTNTFTFSLAASSGPDVQMQVSVLCLGLSNTLKTVLHFGS